MDKSIFSFEKGRVCVPHPLKEELRRSKIRLWMLRNMTGISESQLSRYLNGIDVMPSWLGDKLCFLLDMMKKEPVDNDGEQHGAE